MPWVSVCRYFGFCFCSVFVVWILPRPSTEQSLSMDALTSRCRSKWWASFRLIPSDLMFKFNQDCGSTFFVMSKIHSLVLYCRWSLLCPSLSYTSLIFFIAHAHMCTSCLRYIYALSTVLNVDPTSVYVSFLKVCSKHPK